MKTLYLCGPINGCTDAECKDWREHVKELWSATAIWRSTLDPMRRDYRGMEQESYREIVELDKIDVARSDAIIVNYVKPSVGTAMEMLYAWQLGKPIVLVCAPGTVISPWLLYHAHTITHSFSEAVEKLTELAE